MLLVNELVSNAFKHAFNGASGGMISVSLRRMKKKLELSISDDGHGVKNLVDLKVPSSFGYTIVHGLVQQLRGEIRFESPDKSFRVVVTFIV